MPAADLMNALATHPNNMRRFQEEKALQDEGTAATWAGQQRQGGQHQQRKEEKGRGQHKQHGAKQQQLQQKQQQAQGQQQQQQHGAKQQQQQQQLKQQQAQGQQQAGGGEAGQDRPPPPQGQRGAFCPGAGVAGGGQGGKPRPLGLPPVCATGTFVPGSVVLETAPASARGQRSGGKKYELRAAWGRNAGAAALKKEADGEGDADAAYSLLWEMAHAICRQKGLPFAEPAVWQDPSSAGMLALLLANIIVVVEEAASMGGFKGRAAEHPQAQVLPGAGAHQPGGGLDVSDGEGESAAGWSVLEGHVPERELAGACLPDGVDKVDTVLADDELFEI